MLVVKSIPAFNDNYIWLIHNNQGQCAIVDPGDATPVLSYLQEHQLQLTTILVTHHHSDHVGGIAELKRHFPNAAVVGPKNDAVAGLTYSVDAEQQLELFGEHFTVLSLPGHTLGHIGFYGGGKLFCGDVLFSAGCGRVFEGTAKQMWQSLQKIADLPLETQIYCAHEYTAGNLSFAMAIEPNNPQLHEYREKVNQLRAHQKPTVPTTIEQEKRINPFLRLESAEIIKSVSHRTQDLTPEGVFTALRKWKDSF
ncbi:hydroxyacylglutathione hydrolase [Vibrio rarus]|uniref:hydroxyacylglutathione hydrolase n=1 Tax=Vibrio rarus TaxID=413403 RepID=UPI0021C4AE62|nr:hydroxyacylglutathione hydrolase [Vibrio rarus]